ncbi:ankyrin repeat-containing domain protein [Aspergillus aurantiobrunneus]
MPSLNQLPPEILLSVTDRLGLNDLNSLLRTSRQLASLLQPRFHRLATTVTFRSRGQQKSPLTWAAEHGRPETVRNLLAAGADATKLLDGYAPLHYAVRNGHADVARVLLEAGADPLQVTRNGDVPLLPAAERGHEDTVRLLLEVADMDNPVGRTDYKRALSRAVYFGHLAVARFMLDYAAALDASSAGPSGPGGKRSWLDVEDLLYQAARAGNCDMIRLLLEYGANVPPVHRRATHPLLVAAQNGHKEAVQVLIAARADPAYEEKRPEALCSAMGSGGQSGLSLQDRLYQKYDRDLTRPTKDGRTPLQIALEEFSPPDVIRLLLDLGADVNMRGRGGSTALHTLVRLKRHDLLQTLLSASGSLAASDDKGNTPLLLAVTVGNVAAASLFIRCGADMLARDNHGRTALHIAATLSLSADVSATDDDGRIPLHFATLTGNVSIVQALLSTHDKTSADPLARSKTGRTVLEMAAEAGHLALVDLLIQRGVDVKSDHEGYSALHSAVANKHPEIAQLLLAHGADPLRMEYYGRTPFDLAAGDASMLDKLTTGTDITYTRTDPSTRFDTLKKSVVRFARRIRDGQTADYYKLAKCLVYLNQGEAALAVFRQAAKSRASEDDLRYPMSCSGCRKRLNRSGGSNALVLVCRRCHGLDLCDFADPSFLAFSSTDAGFAVDRTSSTDNGDGNSSFWQLKLEQLIAEYS